MQEALSHIQNQGYNIRHLELDGKLHKFPLDEKDKKESAWYVGFLNDSERSDNKIVVVTFGDWKTNETQKYISKGDHSARDMKMISRRLAEAKARALAERLKKHEDVSVEVNALTENMVQGANEYHMRKKLDAAYGAFLSRGSILIPMRDTDGKLWNFQIITPDGAKFFKRGGRIDSLFHMIGEIKKDKIYISEGFATAASIHMATKEAVACAFNAGNLPKVASAIRKHYDGAKIIICGDDDKWTVVKGKPHNTGRLAAMEAAKQCLGTAVFPEFIDDEGRLTDFNDLHCSEGLEAVKEQLQEIDAPQPYIVPLGYRDGSYFFVSDYCQDIKKISEGNMSSLNHLLGIQSAQYWRAKYLNIKTGEIDKNKAASDLIELCMRRGSYAPDKNRSAGLWLDSGKIIYNRGSCLYYDGADHPLYKNNLSGKHIYCSSDECAPPNVEPLSANEGLILWGAVSKIKWKNKDDAIFFTGWLAASMIGGALSWRPHAWITGESGSGKSYIIEKIVKPLLGNRHTSPLGTSSEAGIRQQIKSRSWPVVIDELETNDRESADRIATITTLFKMASAETDATCFKGTADGVGMQFIIRFCGLVFSIRVNLKNEEDRNRFTVMELLGGASDKRQLHEFNVATSKITGDYSERFFSRMYNLIDRVNASSKVFYDVVMELTGKARNGQQYGTLLGCYWHVVNDAIVTEDEAKTICGSLTLQQAHEVSSEDERRDCLDVLLQSVDKLGRGISNAEYLDAILKELPGLQANYEDETARRGMKITRRDGIKYLAINTKHVYIAEIYKNTKWADPTQCLKRISGSLCGVPTRFGAGPINRSVWVPLSFIFPE